MFDKIKVAWDENPLAVMSVGAVAVSAVASFVNSMSSARSRRAYTKQVNYRIKHGK